ncbi:hypothetical protein FZEAL_4276 [Fusarium zealandicum]|uniref:Uncharacterized protein n=1 Tax=Fusarium zealandicum TaxID=1053134 RepID=A0A8H4XM13_9HYPO|nr:hypothetical protein FZEAL_4276 [Fusarium zealandicum]
MDQPTSQQPAVGGLDAHQPHPNAAPLRVIRIPGGQKWRVKLRYRAGAIVTDIIIIGVSGAALSESDYIPLVYLGSLAVAAIIWNLIEILVLHQREGHRGNHPGVIIAIDLMFWVGWLVLVTFFGMVMPTPDERRRPSDYRPREGDPMHAHPAIYISTLVLVVFEIIFHFILFVIGCREARARRLSASEVIYVQGGPEEAILYPPPGWKVAHVHYTQERPPKPPQPPQNPPPSYTELANL